MIAHGGEDAQQLRGIEDGWRSPAEIDGVGSIVQFTSQFRRELARVGNIFEQAGNVVFVSGLREHVGGEVAVAALGPAEGDRDVEAEGHAVSLYGTMSAEGLFTLGVEET